MDGMNKQWNGMEKEGNEWKDRSRLMRCIIRQAPAWRPRSGWRSRSVLGRSISCALTGIAGCWWRRGRGQPGEGAGNRRGLQYAAALLSREFARLGNLLLRFRLIVLIYINIG